MKLAGYIAAALAAVVIVSWILPYVAVLIIGLLIASQLVGIPITVKQNGKEIGRIVRFQYVKT